MNNQLKWVALPALALSLTFSGCKKEEEKIEEMKRKQEPSGSGGETKATPIQHKAGGKVSSASKRADGCAIRGKTRA